MWLTRPIDDRESNTPTSNGNYLIAHAGGTIDGHTYTNSKEALISSIKKGYKYIELDLFMTEDSDIVCLHKLEDFNKMTGNNYTSLTVEQFKRSSLYGKYSPLTLNEAIEIWASNDFVLVTDRISDPYILKKYFGNGNSRLIVEAFSISDYKQLKEIGFCPMLKIDINLFGLLYYSLAKFILGKVDRITISTKTNTAYLRLYKRLGVEIAAYTANNEEYVVLHLGKDVDFFYTDSLLPRN